MTLSDEIRTKRAELESLRGAVEQADEDAMAKAAALADELDELAAKQERAKGAAEIIARMGAAGAREEATMANDIEFSNIGELAAKSFCGKAPNGGTFSLSGLAEFKTDPTYMGGVQQVQYDRNVANPMPPTQIADLFGVETISGNALTFYQLANLNGAPTAVAENGQKPMVDFTTTAVTVALTKIAAFITESDEMLEDSPWLASAVNNRLVWRLKQVEEAQLLAGNGSAPNMKGVLSTSGIGSQLYDHGGSMGADDVFKAAMKVKGDSGFDADAIILNPADYATIRLAKDSNTQYYGGGYFYGPYGNGGLQMQPALWGIPTYTSTSITQGTALVGAFKMGAAIIRKAGGGITLEATNSNASEFTKNQVTIRAEERIALAVRYPQAFVLVSENPSS